MTKASGRRRRRGRRTLLLLFAASAAVAPTRTILPPATAAAVVVAAADAADAAEASCEADGTCSAAADDGAGADEAGDDKAGADVGDDKAGDDKADADAGDDKAGADAGDDKAGDDKAGADAGDDKAGADAGDDKAGGDAGGDKADADTDTSSSSSSPPGSAPGPAQAADASASAGEGEGEGEGEGGTDEYVGEIDDPCVNLHPNCAKWASEGECKNNPGYMGPHCPRACEICPPMVEGEKEREEEEADVECADLHEMCWKWAEEGECVANPKYMERACRDSCMLCLDLKAAKERGDDEDYIRRKRIYMNLDTGKRQEIPSDLSDDDKYTVKSHLRLMDEYAKGYLLDVSTPDSVRDRCRNAFGLCAHWATEGMCTDRVVHMLNSCPLACRVCDRTEKFHRCTGKRHPHEKAAFEKGGVDEMFREIKGGKWDEYKPEFLTEPKEPEKEGEEGKEGEGKNENDPYLVRFESFLTDEEADRLVQLGDGIGWRESTVDEAEFGAGNPGKTAPRRSSSSAVCGPGRPCESDAIHRAVLDRISSVVGVPADHFESTELVRYGPRDSYGVHHDYRIHDEWKPAGPRVLTVLLVLSDMEEGGATGFPDLDWLFVKARKGTALLWSNVKSDDPARADRRMVHEGLPVVEGTKHVANVWVHQYNWRKAHERDCV